MSELRCAITWCVARGLHTDADVSGVNARLADIGGGYTGGSTGIRHAPQSARGAWADKAGGLGHGPIVGRVRVSIKFRSRAQVSVYCLL